MNKDCRQRYLAEVCSQPMPELYYLELHSGLHKKAKGNMFRKVEHKGSGNKLWNMPKELMNRYTNAPSVYLRLRMVGCSDMYAVKIDWEDTKFYCEGMGKNKVDQLKMQAAKELFQIS